MADSTPRLYEGLFLLNQVTMSGDLDGGIQQVRDMLDRAEAEVHSLHRWDERKLAYPVEGQKRGVFVHSLFTVTPTQIVNIERDCNLSDLVMRVLFTRGDHLGESEIAAIVEGATIIQPPAESTEESEESDGAGEAETDDDTAASDEEAPAEASA